MRILTTESRNEDKVNIEPKLLKQKNKKIIKSMFGKIESKLPHHTFNNLERHISSQQIERDYTINVYLDKMLKRIPKHEIHPLEGPKGRPL